MLDFKILSSFFFCFLSVLSLVVLCFIKKEDSPFFQKFFNSLKFSQWIYLNSCFTLLIASFFLKKVEDMKFLILQIVLLAFHLSFVFLSYWAYQRFKKLH